LDGYEGSFRDAFGPIVPALAHVGFLSSSLDLSYEWKPTDDWRVVPRLRQIFQQPWHTADEYYRPAEEQERTGLYWVPTMERYEGSATVSWSGIEALDLLGGASFTFDRAKDDVKGFADPDDPDATVSEVTYRNIAAFAEALWGTSLADLSIGARFENHSQFGSSFVPRLGLTKSLGSAHVKLLASQAFRAPTIQNLASTPSVTPERATVFEMEFGARLSEHVYFAANVFDSVAKDPIYYYYDDTFDGYRNGSRTGTRGIEIEGRFKLRSHFVNVAYSFYNAARKNEVDVFAVEENPNVLLGFSPHKLTVNSAFEVIDDLSLGASLVFLGGQRYAYTAVNTLGEARLQDLGPVLLLNAHVLYQNAFIRGLSVGLSACNLLNENAAFIQPYNNGHAPLPGTPLEVLLKVAYEMPLI
jgi:outer membrane cobalamin receptor